MDVWIPGSCTIFRWGDFFDCARDWTWSVRALPCLDLWYVTKGVGWISEGKRRQSITAGDCLLLRNGGSYSAGHDPERPLSLIAVHFELLKPGGTRIDPQSDELPPFNRKMEAGGFFQQLLARAVNCHRDGCGEWACAWLQVALMEVIRQDVRTWPTGQLGDQARQIDEICERIRRDPGQRLYVEKLSRELHVSPKHFYRLFRRFQGVSPRAFIIRTRMEAAQMLLLTSSHSVARVAELLGYDSPFYFSRQFKEKVGLSPNGFRQGANSARSSVQQRRRRGSGRPRHPLHAPESVRSHERR